jgi:hypothetical protein
MQQFIDREVMIERLKKQLAEKEKTIKKLRECVEFYADHENGEEE